jgi:hypothetical protein
MKEKSKAILGRVTLCITYFNLITAKDAKTAKVYFVQSILHFD